MDDRELLDELVRVATRLGVEVRIEPFETPPMRGGGRCLVDGREFILLDARAPLGDRVGALASALASLDLEDVYLAPEARDRVEGAREPRILPREGRAARAPHHDGRRRPGALVSSRRGTRRRCWRRSHGRSSAQLPLRVLGGGSNLVVADEGIDGLVLRVGTPGNQHAGERSRGRAHGGGGRAVGRRRPPRHREGVGRPRVPERHPRARRRDAHPERRRLRAGGERHDRGRARAGPHRPGRRLAPAGGLRVRLP